MPNAKRRAGKQAFTIGDERRSSAAKASLGQQQIRVMIIDALEKNALEKLEIIFIAFEYFCMMTDGTVVPAEMAVVRYSVAAGVMDKMHTLINPGCAPLGYARAMKDRAEQYHHLPVPPNALGENNYDTIASRLFEFLGKNGARMPLLFTYPTDVPMVERALQAIVEKCATKQELFVGSLTEIFYRLKSRDWQKVLAPAIYPLQQLIDNDTYQYAETISCEFHAQKELYTECILSRCLRWAYVISDTCCPVMSVAVQPGKHNPPSGDELVQTIDKMRTVSIDDDEPGFVGIFDHGKIIIKESHGRVSIVKGPVPKEATRNAGAGSKPVEDIPGTTRRQQFVQALIDSIQPEAADENPGRSHGRGRGTFPNWAPYGRGVAASNPATYRGRGTLLRTRLIGLAESASEPAEAVSEPAEAVPIRKRF